MCAVHMHDISYTAHVYSDSYFAVYIALVYKPYVVAPQTARSCVYLYANGGCAEADRVKEACA